MCENWRVLPLKKEDAVELARLEELCFSEPWSQEALAGEVENPNAAVFVAWWGDERNLIRCRKIRGLHQDQRG